ncbi:MAG: type I secretion system permease/ATPase [Rhodospirillaceae bacterium]
MTASTSPAPNPTTAKTTPLATPLATNPSKDLSDTLGAVRRCSLALMVLGFFLNLLHLTIPLYMMQVFDRVLSTGSVETLILLSAVALLALAVHGILDGLRLAILNRIAQWVEGRLGAPVMVASVGHALGGRGPGEGFRDLAQIRGFLTGAGITAMLDAPWVPLFIGVLFIVHPWIGAAALAAAIALFALALITNRLTRTPLGAAGDLHATRTRMAEAAGRNAQAVQAMGMMPALVQRWRTVSDAHDAQVDQASTRAAAISGVTRFLRMAVQAGILGLGAWLVLDRSLSPGGMIAASVLLSRALAPVEQTINGWRAFLAARTALGRLHRLLGNRGLPAQVGHTTMPRPDGAWVLEDVTLQPDSAPAPILEALSLRLSPGKVTAILGPSAAGKSSLCRLLVGVMRPTTGSIQLDGIEMNRWRPEDLGPHLGYLPQEVELFPATVRENISRLADAPDEAVIKAAKLAGVHALVASLPQGYDTPLGEGGFVLSGGQRQRIGLARALFGDPALVVLDEPNANLDAEGERALVETILGLRQKNVTVVLVAHRRAVLRGVDEVLYLEAGRLRLHGPRDKALAEIERRMAPAPNPGPKPTAAIGTVKPEGTP